MSLFLLQAPYKPSGDQPQAIKQLVQGLADGKCFQTLLGVTGSGKTYTMANVIEQTQRPALVISHNKTLAAQLYSELREFFPNNAVEYFVSYYDYYQPEAYLPTSDTYIEKDLAINQDLEKLRLSTTSTLLSGRRDVIVVASVSCLYGLGNPADFEANTIRVKRGEKIARSAFLYKLLDALYSRDPLVFERGRFRVKGDNVEVYLAYADTAARITFFGDEIEELAFFDPLTAQTIEKLQDLTIYPANIFVTTKDRMQTAMRQIQDDLLARYNFLLAENHAAEAARLKERVEYDMEMMKELGYCSGIENYSRYFDGRQPGTRPYCLLDYFAKDFLCIIDESHVSIPQMKAMYGGDRARKTNLVEYGFRLPAAFDNRPLTFEEFETVIGQTIFVSATPADYELERSNQEVVEQIIRPTGLVDPPIIIRPIGTQLDDLLKEINKRIPLCERILVTTLTKRMAEELTEYLAKLGVKARYLHSDVETLERIEIMEQLRNGTFDVLVGVNLLREGLDLPEVSLVAILDADKEGFLRSERSLTQTAGRAARNLNGLVIMYADSITQSMQKTIDASNYRRTKQLEHNAKHGITPQAVVKAAREIIGSAYKTTRPNGANYQTNISNATTALASEPGGHYNASKTTVTLSDIERAITETEQAMKQAAKDLNFLEAAALRDELKRLKAKKL